MINSDAIKIEFDYREEFAIYIAKEYANDVEFWEKMIKDSQALRWCLLDVYNWMVGNRGMGKYERMGEEAEKGKQVCACLWLLNFVFEKYFV